MKPGGSWLSLSLPVARSLSSWASSSSSVRSAIISSLLLISDFSPCLRATIFFAWRFEINKARLYRSISPASIAAYYARDSSLRSSFSPSFGFLTIFSAEMFSWSPYFSRCFTRFKSICTWRLAAPSFVRILRVASSESWLRSLSASS